jgi:hypothetical protein
MGQSTQGVRQGGSRSFSKFIAGLNDAMLLLLLVLLFPVAILLVGAPIALMVRALVEIAHRF